MEETALVRRPLRAGDEGVAPGKEGGQEEVGGFVGTEDGVEEALAERLE